MAEEERTKLKCRAQSCISHIRELIPSESWVALAGKGEKFLDSSSKLKSNHVLLNPKCVNELCGKVCSNLTQKKRKKD